MKTFKITKHLTIVCEAQNTRYGFRHLANLLRDGYEIGSAKCCYYNRTWEAFEYQSVIQALQRKAAGRLSTYEARKFTAVCKNGDRKPAREFNAVKLAAAFGAIISPDQKARNDFQKRILEAGLSGKGLEFPEDWDQLSEDEKSRRLNGAIAQL
jgi:hypothetical protein